MSYRYSKLDRDLMKWFQNDNSHALLRGVSLDEGTLRGLNPFDINFDYPITAVAGINGSGKSTILAMVACGYHNVTTKAGYKKYYTFNDFFIQTKEEVPVEGLEISYLIAHNNWKKTEYLPEGVGVGRQVRRKPQGGKWNNYDRRVYRDVEFFGIERIVPHSEKSVSRSYSKYFKRAERDLCEFTVKDIVGKILKKPYDDYVCAKHAKYKIPIVTAKGETYSGFNMGAGENTLFEIFSKMLILPQGSLFVIDEIELGLHIEAQKRFVAELKNLALERKIQVVCTTHSKAIFECLPPCARIFIEKRSNNTNIINGVSPDYAFGKLSGEHGRELDILVEDNVAKIILQNILSAEIRSRVNIEVLGSHSVLVRQMSSIAIRKVTKETIVIFDGYQSKEEAKIIKRFSHEIENHKVREQKEQWFRGRINFLPSDTWPENWLVQEAKYYLDDLAEIFRCDEDELECALEEALESGKHSEFYSLGEELDIAPELCLDRVAQVVCGYNADEFIGIVQQIEQILDGDN